MSAASMTVPPLAADVVLRQIGTDEYVVKQRRTGSYFRVGPVEHFLFGQLDGQATREDVRKAYEQQFSEPLSDGDLSEFLAMAGQQGLLQGTAAAANSASAIDDDEDDEFGSTRGQSWLYFRVRLFDPSAILDAIEPRIAWVWTPAFLALAAIFVLSAAGMLWAQRADFVTSFRSAWRWETFCLIWVCILGATLLHEFAHGLTCRHFGGEVREIGALMIFGTPSMYCDITDAWMIPNRWQRMWITLAGSVCDLLVFATAAFVWRITMLDTLVNYVAWVLASVCGTRVFFNLNPLMRLDGYYLAVDWLQIPNLRQTANAYWKGHLRHWLWGANRPPPAKRGWVLLTYGGLYWSFAVLALDVLGIALLGFFHSQFGWWGLAVMSVLLMFVGKRVFKGLFTSEFMTMVTTRPQRTVVWLTGLALTLIALAVVPVDRLVSGQFEVRPGARLEVRSEIAGFVHTVHAAEGAAVRQGDVIATLQVPDLSSQIVRKEAEIRESEAQLRKLRMGPRPEEIAEQKHKVARAKAWRDLAERDLERARLAHEQELVRLDLEIKQFKTELEYEQVSLTNVERLYKLGAMAGEARRAEYKRLAQIEAQLGQANAERRARQVEGLREAEAELARRGKELADTEAALKLLEAGTRPEEIDAETARRTRLQEELEFLQDQQAKLEVRAPMDGVVATPRMLEKIGQLSDKGGLVCVVEDVRTLNVEISIAEESVAGIEPGQSIRLKARALPFDTFLATVDRIAPSASNVPGQHQNQVTVYCRVENADGKLKSGMTGFARIHRGRQSIAEYGVRQALTYLRTEFWW
jgi:multidrug efflux pump subunit AcrA (membrane-fusion protein)